MPKEMPGARVSQGELRRKDRPAGDSPQAARGRIEDSGPPWPPPRALCPERGPSRWAGGEG